MQKSPISVCFPTVYVTNDVFAVFYVL